MRNLPQLHAPCMSGSVLGQCLAPVSLTPQIHLVPVIEMRELSWRGELICWRSYELAGHSHKFHGAPLCSFHMRMILVILMNLNVLSVIKTICLPCTFFLGRPVVLDMLLVAGGHGQLHIHRPFMDWKTLGQDGDGP